jgi:hypothetical protein
MEKQLYWLVESNGDLSTTIKDIADAKDIIEGDFAYESEDGEFDVEDLQYTITPQMITQDEFEALGEV